MDSQPPVVLVTGAAGNLGAAICQKFATDGARLVAVDLSADTVRDRLAHLGLGDDRLLALGVNILDETAVQALANQAGATFGRIDVLANVAGGFTMGTPVHATPLATWRHMLDLNATSVLILAQAVVPVMLAQSHGRIINVSARAALKGEALMAAYCVGKAAVLRLTEAMAAELGDSGITVNCILPSMIDTPQNRSAMPEADFSKWVTAASLADTVAFLASEQARDISGGAIPVYGRA
ncbi:MAG: SDR family oxidoreductase [Candidatus Sericytochromatia bacterium]|nr:SDR family oxidoreductase [Candidatus Sericytochromatia bacterium]